MLGPPSRRRSCCGRGGVAREPYGREGAALLAALTAQQTFGDGHELVLDARVAGVAAAAVALVLRAPFLVVVAAAVVVTAGVRPVGG